MCAVIEHLGGSAASSGHYVAFKKISKDSDTWGRISDESITEIADVEQILRHT